MKGEMMKASSGSLRSQVSDVETRIKLRRQNIHGEIAEANQKFVSWLTSPASLLVALGVGIVIEQSTHRRNWSLATLIQAASAGIGLAVSLSNTMQQTNSRTPRPRP